MVMRVPEDGGGLLQVDEGAPLAQRLAQRQGEGQTEGVGVVAAVGDGLHHGVQ